jgi:hypothetical protein
VFIYTVSVSGMVVKQRFCGSKLFDSGLMGTLDDCCAKKMMKDCDKNCCLDKAEIIKVETAHETPVTYKSLKILPVLNFTFFHSKLFSTFIPVEKFSSEIDLLPQKIPLRILVSSFRI